MQGCFVMATKVFQPRKRKHEQVDSINDELFYELHLQLYNILFFRTFQFPSKAPVIEPLFFQAIITKQLQSLYGIHGSAMPFHVTEYDKTLCSAIIRLHSKYQSFDFRDLLRFRTAIFICSEWQNHKCRFDIKKEQKVSGSSLIE